MLVIDGEVIWRRLTLQLGGSGGSGAPPMTTGRGAPWLRLCSLYARRRRPALGTVFDQGQFLTQLAWLYLPRRRTVRTLPTVMRWPYIPCWRTVRTLHMSALTCTPKNSKIEETGCT